MLTTLQSILLGEQVVPCMVAKAVYDPKRVASTLEEAVQLAKVFGPGVEYYLQLGPEQFLAVGVHPEHGRVHLKYPPCYPLELLNRDFGFSVQTVAVPWAIDVSRTLRRCRCGNCP